MCSFSISGLILKKSKLIQTCYTLLAPLLIVSNANQEMFNMLGSECLEWKMRFKVAIGVAEGLHYLHRDCPRRIIHRDIKASNILLNENNEAEVLM